jgi:uncharacterized membrane protein
MHAEIVVLRLIHVLGGIFWVGTAVFVAAFLLPAMGAAGPASSAVMGGLIRRRMFTIVPVVALATMLAGLRLMWINSTGFAASYFASNGGRTYATGAILALVAFTLFLVVNHPAIGTMTRLGQQLAQAPEHERAPILAEMAAVRAKVTKASTAAATLLALTAVAMAVGRYM